MDDHPVRAVAAALGMLEKLDAINRARSEEARFSIRIGINSGKAIAGDIGSLKRMEYTVLGNTVNIASRLESTACSPNQVVIGTDTFNRIKDEFDCEDLGLYDLKGLTEQTRVYRVIRQLSQ